MTDFHFSLSCTEEGNGNPLQCSCLENPRDGGCRLWGHTESDTTDATAQQQQQQGLFSSCRARASHRGGFSRCRAPALGTQVLAVVARGLSSYSS